MFWLCKTTTIWLRIPEIHRGNYIAVAIHSIMKLRARPRPCIYAESNLGNVLQYVKSIIKL
jgi:hypothetical protein